MKRTLALILALVLSLACVFAGSAFAEEEPPRFKIGIVYYSLTDTLGTETVKMANAFGEMFNCEMQFIQPASTDEALTAVENLCAAGCQAILSCYVDATLPSVLNVCSQYGCYFGAISREVNSDEIQQTIEQMPAYEYWIGGVHENEYEAGYSLVQTLYDQGCRKFALLGQVPGSSSAHDDRFTGFEAALADLGLEPVSVGRGNLQTEGPEFINNMLTMDIDAMVVTGSGMDICIQPIAAAGLTGQVKLGTVDIGEGALEALENGSVSALMGGHAIDVVFSLVNAYNYLTGHPLSEEPANFLLNYIVVDSAEVYEEYLKYVDGDVFPYTKEELQQFMPYYNPDATYEDLQAAISAWSIEDVKTRHADMFEE